MGRLRRCFAPIAAAVVVAAGLAIAPKVGGNAIQGEPKPAVTSPPPSTTFTLIPMTFER